jgi:ATP-dependent DNA ligase
MPPVTPMLARAARGVPDGPGFLYEPKWDGFRCIAFRDGDEVHLGSRGEKPLTRYFPEVVAGLLAEAPARCVLDGEIVVALDGRLDFDALSQRIHPAQSRVRELSAATPATYVVFDVLCLDDADLTGRPLRERRRLLGDALAGSGPTVVLTPATGDPVEARRWFTEYEGAGLDGVVAKPLDLAYRPGERVLTKVKHERTADCVVAGYARHASGDGVGSLLLGLHGEDGTLHHVGVCASFSAARRRELEAAVAAYVLDEGEPHPWVAAAADGPPSQRLPRAPSRWNRSAKEWTPLRPDLVVEVAYDHMQRDRFRHTTQFRRWRPDRDPASCTYAQLDRPVHLDLAAVLAGG